MTRTTVRGVQFMTALAAVGLAAFGLPASAWGAGVVGTGNAASCTDDALHTALMGGGTVTFNCGAAPVTIDLTSLPGAHGTETIATDTTIDGGGLITLSGGNTVGVFVVNSGINFTVRNLAITDGVAVDGAGISNSGMLTVTNSTLSGNNASHNAGAISNDGTLTVANSILSGNSAASGGGAIASLATVLGASASLVVINSTLSDNSANDGGAIVSIGVFGGSTSVEIANSTLSGNTANTNGGGIFSEANFAGTSSLVISSSTLTGNSGVLGGGNISNYSPDGSQATVEIGNTILNAGSPGGNISNGGTFTSRGYNLSSDAAGGDGTTGPGGLLSATGDIRNSDPLLGPLQPNGGPTATHALVPGSPAIDQGKRDTILALASNTDQRGFLRPIDDPTLTNASGGDGSDIGAFEVQRPTGAPVPVASPTGLLAVLVLLSAAGCLTLRRPARSHSSKADASVGA